MVHKGLMTAASPPAARPARPLALRAMALTLLALAAAAIFVQHLWLAQALPLWFDEAWTAEVAATPTLRTFHAEVMNDIQAPAYYAFMRLWAAAAGTSDLALRLPGIGFLACAAALPLSLKLKGLDGAARLAWSVLLLGWWGVGVFLLGRGYSLLLAISTLQAICFARLLAGPSRANALRWCAVAALAILTQYLALIAVAAQGLVYLIVHRRTALSTWPALAAFVPVGAWMAIHLPRLADFAGMQSWHPLVGPTVAVSLAAFAIDPSTPLVLPLAALILIAALARPAPVHTGGALSHLWLTALAALLGLALFLGAGAIRPILTPRYLIPVVPGLLLGLVLCARRSAHSRAAYGALMALYLAAAMGPSALQSALRLGAPYGYERASDTLMRRGVTQTVFVWDHQAARFERPASIERAGAVFFRRARYPMVVTPLRPDESDDVSALALAAATGTRPGIIWIYNRDSPTAARTHPPRIAALDPRWTCERSGDETVGSLACWRRP